MGHSSNTANCFYGKHDGALLLDPTVDESGLVPEFCEKLFLQIYSKDQGGQVLLVCYYCSKIKINKKGKSVAEQVH